MNKEVIRLKLLQQYPFLKGVYISEYCYDYNDLKLKLGKLASRIFETIIYKYDNPKVGIGGGSTIYNMVQLLKTQSRNIRIFPTAIIGRGPEINHIDSSFLVNLLYLKSSPLAKGFILNIPPLPNKLANARKFIDMLNEIDEIKWIKSAMCEIDCCFIGAGSIMPTGDFDDEANKLGINYNSLLENNVIGGINYNWLTENGTQFGSDFITLPIDKLRELSSKNKDVVLIAGGSHKNVIIKTALEKHIVNSLITDLETAKQILRP
jgi:DNA-binding transcriptional regulator LsrR (DeoR family)